MLKNGWIKKKSIFQDIILKCTYKIHSLVFLGGKYLDSLRKESKDHFNS